jgi:hypothetical protein
MIIRGDNPVYKQIKVRAILMDNTLKNALEDVVKTFVDLFEKQKLTPPKKVVLCASSDLKNSTLVFNYLENCFLNTQFMIDNRLPIEKIDYYNEERYKTEGDYIIDISKYLTPFKLKDSSFLP